MALIQKSFDSYLIYYRSGPGTSEPRAFINFFQANSYVGGVRFIAEGIPLPANAGTPSSIEIYYSLPQFNDVVGILRYEKPLWLLFDSGTLVGYLSTSAEPIGEQEGV